MPLEKQIVDMPLGTGQNEGGTDPKLVRPGEMLRVRNGYIERDGEIQKRFGSENVSNSIEGGGTLPVTPRLLHSMEPGLVHGASTNADPVMSVYERSPTTETWLSKGNASAAILRSKAVAGQCSVIHNMVGDAVVQNGLLVAGRTEANYDAEHKFVVLDEGTLAQLEDEKFGTTDLDNPYVMFPCDTDDRVILLVHTPFMPGTANINYRYYDTVANAWTTVGLIGGAGVKVNPGTDGDTPHDGATLDGSDFLYAYENTSNGIEVKSFNSAGTVQNTYTNNTYTPEAIALKVFNSKVWVILVDSTAGLVAIGLNSDLTLFAGPTVLDATATAAVSVTAEELSGVIYAFYTEGTTARYMVTNKAWFTAGATITPSTGTVSNQVALITKAKNVGNRIVMGVAHGQDLDGFDSTLCVRFLCDESGNAVARFSEGEAFDSLRPVRQGFQLPQISSIDANTFTFVLPRAVSLIPIDLLDSYAGEYRQYTFTIDEGTFPAVNVNGAAFIATGLTQSYDHKTVEVAGFAIPPSDIDTLASSAATGSVESLATYSVKFTYEWVDGLGNLYESSPSLATTVTTGSADDTITATIPIPSNAFDTNKEMNIVVYRTEKNGTVHYRDVTILVDPSGSADSQNATLTQSDEDLTDNPVLYTDQGIVQHTTPPAAIYAVKLVDKVLLVTAENRKAIWESRPIQSSFGLQFSQQLLIEFPGAQDIVGLAYFDDKVIVFCDTEVWFFSGSGRDATGVGGFTTPRRLTNNVGCKDCRTIITTPAGTLFQADRGFYLLDRGLQIQHVGKAVEAYKDTEFTGSFLNPERQHVWFTSTSVTLVYDYTRNMWFEYKGNYLSTLNAVIDNELPYWHNPSNGIAVQTTGYTDPSATAVELRVRTPWLTFNSLAEFKRIWEFFITGEFRSAHTLNVRVLYDYDLTSAESIAITSTDVQTVAEDPYIARVQQSRQKCTAIAIQIFDSDQDGTFESLALTSLSFELGMKRGLRKKGTP